MRTVRIENKETGKDFFKHTKTKVSFVQMYTLNLLWEKLGERLGKKNKH